MPNDKNDVRPAIVCDVDGTICRSDGTLEGYERAEPIAPMIETLRAYKEQGFRVALYTARNMRTFGGNIGRVNAVTARTLLNWLERHGVPHDEIYNGKPWPGQGGFYVDDRCVRPDEFRELPYQEILALLARGGGDE